VYLIAACVPFRETSSVCKLIPRIPPFIVTQGHWNRHGSIHHLLFPISVL